MSEGTLNNRLRLASFRTQLHTSNTHDTPGVAIDDAVADHPDDGLLMAVTDPEATRVYGEVEGDSEGEGDMGEDMEVEEGEEWSDAVDAPVRGVHPQDEEDDVFSTPMPSHASFEGDHLPPLPQDIGAGPSRPTSGRSSDSPHPIPTSTLPRMSTVSEPVMRRTSLDGLFPPPRLSADAIVERREDAPHASPTSRSERQARRRSFDPRTALGKLNFIRTTRSTEILDTPPVPPIPPPAPLAPSQTPPSSRRRVDGRSRSPAHSGIDPTPTSPPPPLPAPSLTELGLQLKPVTPLLAAAHLGGVPTSGCLLSPGYLLLCHNDGLDVVPLYAPPAARAYALIRGVPFKSVLVMDMLGFLVAIAGRREGVRVYALSDIKRAIELRMDAERQKESAKRKTILMEPLSNKMKKVPSRPESATSPIRSPSAMGPVGKLPPVPPTSSSQRVQPRLRLQTQRSNVSGRADSPVHSLAHQPSVSSIRMSTGRTSRLSATGKDKEKTEWVENETLEVRADSESEDEGYVSVPGPSGERTETPSPIPPISTSNSFSGRRRRPADLQLDTLSPHNGMVLISDPLPSPAPSMVSMREALAAGPTPARSTNPSTSGREVVGLADLLRDSRIPDLPPAGTRLPQNTTFTRDRTTGATTLVTTGRTATPTSLSPDTISPATAPMRWGANAEASLSAVHLAPPISATTPRSARQRWSLLGGNGLLTSSPPTSPMVPPESALSEFNPSLPPSRPPSVPPRPPSTTPLATPRHSRGLFPRLFTNGFKPKGSSEPNPKRNGATTPQGQGYIQANGKLEHIKLEGTRGAYLIKSVQTNRKSFLAILCGEDGKKVELFTGSSKSASLSLARTFILPDSPLSLELQVQGEDLAELFLIFSDSVFALEPASVRVRQVNIARAERRAARRRRERERAGSDAAELNNVQQTPVANSFPLPDPTPNRMQSLLPPPPPYSTQAPVLTTKVTSTVTAGPALDREGARRRRRRRSTGFEGTTNGTELRGPNQKSSPSAPSYTTFQQLFFSPTFPLGTLAEDWIIPPSYPSFVKHKEWLQNNLEKDDSDQDRDVTQPPAEYMYNLWHGIMNSWPRRGSLREGLLQTLPESSTVTLEDYFLPPVSLLAQPSHYGPPSLFFCSRGGLSTAIVDHKGKSVLLDKFHWSSPSTSALKDKYARRPAGLGDVQKVEAFDGHNNGAVLVAIRDSGLEAVDIADALLTPSTTAGIAPAAAGSYSRRLTWSWDVADPFPSNADSAGPNSASPTDPRALAAAKLNGVINSPIRSATQPGRDYHNNQFISYLGREGSRVYMCTRSAHMFRVICLQPSVA
ncbi:hypothetical protein DACRYDRAFT_116336 [Dacryopinax primogenitus]|uniref:CNH domain-containing protein n=1 Tax=Dacryopinax primogenitus (strain DJM 731) TaxID=1858805 RepID=M5FVQ9_DACPD|nr:uncharacterized protein DACRYDRAFT_116336 [Dacryopinax primogenitus]EJU01916.1 hypothetical protein DACRYDRAFT_116336 [Dacryopinax primogenitus]